MPGGTARQRMTMRAVIERDMQSGSNPDGHPDVPNWQTLATVPCIFWSRARRHAIDTEKDALIEDLRMAVPLSADVTELDRVARIEDRLGTVLLAGPVLIQAGQYKHDHREFQLKRVA